MTELSKIVSILDKELRIDAFTDSSHNGLQVENTGPIRKVCMGVDASLEFFKAAKELGANLLICHHGLSWGDSLKRITDRNYKLISFLVNSNMALYACHLPLDAHKRLGNNIGLCRVLGLRVAGSFGEYHGTNLGFVGRFSRPVSCGAFKKLVRDRISGDIRTMDFGKSSIRTVAIIAGCAPKLVEEAGRLGADVFLSGEPSLEAYNLAMEYRINAVFAGHYATERFGVIAVGRFLGRKLGLSARFVPLDIPY